MSQEKEFEKQRIKKSSWTIICPILITITVIFILLIISLQRYEEFLAVYIYCMLLIFGMVLIFFVWLIHGYQKMIYELFDDLVDSTILGSKMIKLMEKSMETKIKKKR